MAARDRWRLVFSLACCALLGFYLAWLTALLDQSAWGGWRALATCVAAALLLHQAWGGVPTRRDRSGAVAIATAAALALPFAARMPWAWAAWLPTLAAAAALGLHGHAAFARRPMLMAMAALAFPYEAMLPATIDSSLQAATARAAAALVNASGLPVVLQGDPPALLGPQGLVVSVTALCAGTSTLFSLVTLGVLLAELSFTTLGTQALCVLMAPAFGLAGNVLRVALSTHAANRWAEDAVAWPIAHDAIGYVTFALSYAALFISVRALRQWRPRAASPAISSSASGQSVASP